MVRDEQRDGCRHEGQASTDRTAVSVHRTSSVIVSRSFFLSLSLSTVSHFFTVAKE
jgi:hypothetical protein